MSGPVGPNSSVRFLNTETAITKATAKLLSLIIQISLHGRDLTVSSVVGWITGTISEEVVGLVVELDTSTEVWQALVVSFAQEREFYLHQRLQMHSKEDYSMSEYIRLLKNYCDKLAAIGKPIDDRNKVFKILK